MAGLNVLFLGETNLGEGSIIDLITGSREQRRAPRHAGRRALGDEVRSVAVTLGGKKFKLHVSPTSESTSPVAPRERIQHILTDLCSNGGVRLLVYCMNFASHSNPWIHEMHRTITSNSILPSRIPTVAVIVGMSDVVQQDNWWSRNEGVLANQGLHFDAHTFIQMMTAGSQSPAGDHISENRHALHTLILQNCAYALNSETDSDFQHTAPYKQRSVENSFQSLVTLARKPSSHTSTGSKSIDIVLLGEIGVGKSSLINLIVREKVAGVSSDTIGCTKTIAEYTCEEKGRTFRLYDTPGLVDPQMGAKSFVDPIDTIQRLIRSLGNGNGPHLVLFCAENSKPTVALQRNYRLFSKIICKGKVPFALAITKLEEGQDADQWWSQHRATIRRYGIGCLGYVGVGLEKRCSDPNPGSEGRFRESFLSFFATCTDRQKHKENSLLSSMGRKFGSVPSFLRSQESTLERTLMNQCGLEEQIARELANRMVP